MEVRNGHQVRTDGIDCPEKGFIFTGSYPAGEICPGCKRILLESKSNKLEILTSGRRECDWPADYCPARC